MITLSAKDLAQLLTNAKQAGAQGAPDYSERDAQNLASAYTQDGLAFCRQVLEQHTCAVPLPSDCTLDTMFEEEPFTYVAEVGDVYSVAVIHSYHLAAVRYEDATYYFWVLDPEDVDVPEEEEDEDGE